MDDTGAIQPDGQAAAEASDAQVLAQEEAELLQLAGQPVVTRYKRYVAKTGPGWLQSAITLGGGSLGSSLYLGMLGGFSLLWLQPLAMVLGIIMLSSIGYVTLSTGKRPFQAINDHVNPVLGWGWLIATLMANVVWCMPQFALGTAALQQNLLPGLTGTGGKVVACVVLLAAACVVIWFYDSGSKGIRVFEIVLKTMVGLIIACFFGVVIKLSAAGSGLPWGAILKGFVPNIRLLAEPAPTFNAALSATGEFAGYWSGKIVGMQRDVMIAAAATAVGINMTFLLPYSMLKKGWRRAHRELAVFDLAMGLFVPFLLAISCVVIAAASRFHAEPQPGVADGTAPAKLVGQYKELLAQRLAQEVGAETLAAMTREDALAAATALPEGDKRMAAMLVKRDAFNLAASLEGLTGKTFSHYVFGVGVVGMALSSIIILMLINGFVVCEMVGLPDSRIAHRVGCYMVGIGVLGPFIWSGKTLFWLAVPTSVFGFTLIPIAYLTFFLMINNRGLMGAELPRGRKRLAWNVLMIIALMLIVPAALWTLWNKAKWVGVGILAVFVGLAVIVHFVRPPKAVEAPVEG